MKASIVGIEHVGSSVGLILVVQDLVDDLVLVSRRRDVAAAEALDLMHAGAFTNRPTDVRAGGVADTAGADAVILCAAGHRPPASEAQPQQGATAAPFRDLVLPFAAAIVWTIGGGTREVMPSAPTSTTCTASATRACRCRP